MSDYDSDFDPKTEVYAQTFSAEEQEEARKMAAEAEDQRHTLSEDWLRTMDGKGSGGPSGFSARRPGRDGRSVNTGAKGVLADYEVAKQKMRARRLEEKLAAERAINATAVGVERASTSAAASSLDDLDDLDSEDDAAFEQFKQERFRALQSKQQQTDASPYWGKLEEATVGNYIEEVEDAPDTHFIVVHLYQPFVEECVRVNFALMNLAEKFPRVRFMRGVCTDLLPTFDEIGLPTLLLYRGGRKLNILVRITDEIGANFADKDLVLFLHRHGVLSAAQVDLFVGGSARRAAAAAASGASAVGDDAPAERRSGVAAFRYSSGRMSSGGGGGGGDDDDDDERDSRKKISISRVGREDDDE